MAADSEVNVKITATTADFDSAMRNAATNATESFGRIGTSAKQLKATLTEMQSLYAQLGDAGKASLAPQMAALEQQVVAAQRAEQAIASTANAADNAAAATRRMYGATGTAAREFRALFDELSSGRIYQTPSTLAIIGQRVLGLSTGTLVAAGGAVALAYGLVKLAESAVRAANALDNIKIGAKFSGDLDLTTEAIHGLEQSITDLSNLSSKDADKVIGSFARIRNVTAPLLQGLSAQIADYAAASGQKAEKASQEWQKSFSDPIRYGHEFVTSLAGVTQAQIDAVDAARRDGDANATAAAMLDAMNSALARVRPMIDQHNRSVTASVSNWISYGLAVEGGMQADEYETGVLASQNVERAKQIRLINAAIAALHHLPAGTSQTIVTAVSAGDKENKTDEQMLTVQAHIAEINKGLETARQLGDQINVDRLSKDLDLAKQHLDQLQFGPVMERARAEIANLSATWTGSQSALLTAERDVWSRYLTQVRSGSKEALSIQQSMDRDTAQMHRQTGQEAIAQVRNEISQKQALGTLSRDQTLAFEKDAWSKLLSGDALTAAQRIEVERTLNLTLAQLHGSQVNEHLRSLEAITDTAKRGSAARIAAARQEVVFAVQTFGEGSTQAIVAQRHVTEATQAASNQRIAVNAREINAQIQLLDRQLQSTIQHDQSGVKSGQMSSEDARKAETKAADEIYSRELLLVNQEIALYQRGTVAWQQAEDKKVAISEKWASETQRINDRANQQMAAQWQKSFQPIDAGFNTMISGLLRGRQTLNQALISGAQQVVIKEIESDAQILLHKLEIYALEETGALTKDQAILASREMSDTASIGSMLLNAVKAVTADAGQTFGGVFAFLAPTMGPAAAGPAAASSAAVLAAMPTSLDVGTDMVLRTGLALVHEGESVVPAAQTSGAYSGGGTPAVTINVQALDGNSVQSWLSRSGALQIARAINRVKTVNPSIG